MVGNDAAAVGAKPEAAAVFTVVVGLEKGIQYGIVGDRPLLLDAHLPAEDGEDRPGIILVHGGGWRRGDRSDLRDVSGRLADMGWVSFSIDYRLDEPSGYPAEVEDVERAVTWVHQNADQFGVDPARLAIVGSSVGGNLAALAATRADGSLDVGPLVQAVVSFSGPMDLSSMVLDGAPGADEPGIVIDYLGCEPGECPSTYRAASPVTHVDEGDPPMLLVASEGDRVPPAQAQAMMERLDSLGNGSQLRVVQGDKHGKGLIDPLWDEMIAFLSTPLGLDGASMSRPSDVVPDGATSDGDDPSTESAEELAPSEDRSTTAAPSAAQSREQATATKRSPTDPTPAESVWLPLGAIVLLAAAMALALLRQRSRSGGRLRGPDRQIH